MKRSNIKEWLKIYDENNIQISKHITVDRAYRGIDENLIKESLLKPDGLIRLIEEQHDKDNEYKFKLRFKISRSKTLGLVVILNEVLKVITAYIINNKWERLWKKKS